LLKRAFFLAAVPILLGGGLDACSAGTTRIPARSETIPTPRPAPLPPVFGPVTIDAAIRAEWARLGATPAPRVDDARFLRRAYLDVVGTVPPPSVVRDFLADPAADKRARLVDSLLASPAYAVYWATLWEDSLVGWRTREPDVDRGALREWLEREFAANTPWDALVTGLITATGQNSPGGRRSDGAPAPPDRGDGGALSAASEAPINGAVNWFLKYRDAPQDLAGSASRLFLGVQIQCAQCHDHKTESWKQDDFRRFAACFARTKSEPIDQGKVIGRRRVFVEDLGRPLPRFVRNPDLAPITMAQPAALDGVALGASPDVRRALASWMTARTNPWFARAIVNRMWGHFLGRGFVDPVDDLRDSNPATMPDVLTRLSEDFAASGDDLKALIRTIAATEAYQLATGARREAWGGADADDAARLWARFHVTPLGPNELLRSILDVTGVEEALGRGNRANLDRIRFQLNQRYSFLFDLDEELEQTEFEGTVAQALALLNGDLVGGGTAGVVGGALDAILREPGSDADKVVALYVRTVTRTPSDQELEYWTRYVNEPRSPEAAGEGGRSVVPPPLPRNKVQGKAGNKTGAAKPSKPAGSDALARLELRDLSAHPDARRQAYADLFWALLNSSEFTLNH